MQRRLVVLAALVLAGLLAGCGAAATPTPAPPAGKPAGTLTAAGTPAAPAQPAGKPGAKRYSAPPPMTIDPKKKYTAIMTTTKGVMTIELLAGEAPKTVNNFVFLAREGFCDGTIFHRTIRNFMIQGGDPTGTGSGGPGYRFDDEPVTRDYKRGTLAMANAGKNTNGSQFFIVHQDYPLPPNYTIFGQVTSGLEVLDAIATAPVGPSPTGEQSKPQTPVQITKIEIQEG